MWGISLFFFLFEYQRDFNLLKSNHYSTGSYTDELSGGKSRTVLFKNDNEGILFKYKIFPDVNSYAGFNILIDDTVRSIIQKANQVKIVLKTKNINSLYFIIRTFEEGISSEKNDVSHRMNAKLLNVNNGENETEFTIEFEELKQLGWWIRRFAKGQSLKTNPKWETSSMFSIIKEMDTDPKNKSEIHLKKLTIVKSNKTFFIYSGIIIFLSLIISLFFQLWKNKRSVIKVSYKSVETPSKSSENWKENILIFIANNYQNPDLKLKKIAENIGKSEREVSRVIKEKLNISYNQHLNQIRIQEAKRLLKETDLSIKEISYSVGYLPDHFRKVFSNSESCTPSEFRNNTLKNTEKQIDNKNNGQ